MGNVVDITQNAFTFQRSFLEPNFGWVDGLFQVNFFEAFSGRNQAHDPPIGRRAS